MTTLMKIGWQRNILSNQKTIHGSKKTWWKTKSDEIIFEKKTESTTKYVSKLTFWKKWENNTAHLIWAT